MTLLKLVILLWVLMMAAQVIKDKFFIKEKKADPTVDNSVNNSPEPTAPNPRN